MGRINVLSIDGGGIRGIIAAAILEALQAQIGRELHEVFDLISGTSTGGIIALGIGTPAKNGRPYRPAESSGRRPRHVTGPQRGSIPLPLGGLDGARPEIVL